MAPPPLPSGPALVRATLLITAVAAHAPAKAQESTPIEVAPPPPDLMPDAPTCGPCCHGSADCDGLVPVIEKAYVENVGTVQMASTVVVVTAPEHPFQRGDGILEVNGQPVGSLAALGAMEVLGAVTIQRGAEILTIQVTGPIEVAPTCGPCCHGSADCVDSIDPPPPPPSDPRAERRAERDARRAERKARRESR